MNISQKLWDDNITVVFGREGLDWRFYNPEDDFGQAFVYDVLFASFIFWRN